MLSGLQHTLRELRAVLDAVGHGDAAQEVAADVEAGEGLLDLPGAVHEAAVADLVLRDGPGPAADELPGGLAAQAQRSSQLVDEGGGDAVLVPGGELGIGAAAGEGGE